eukprot:258752_1
MGNKSGTSSVRVAAQHVSHGLQNWSWNNNGNWESFDADTSKEIDDSIQYMWTHTMNNPLIFTLTRGAWFSQNRNRNVYKVWVYLNNTRSDIVNIYQLNTNTSFQRKMRRTPPFTLDCGWDHKSMCKRLISLGFDQSVSQNASMFCATTEIAIEYITNSYKSDNAQQTVPMNIAIFQDIDNPTRYLVFGYLRRMQSQILGIRMVPMCVYQICSVFCYDPYKFVIKIGEKIDARDRWGKWYVAEIQQHKKATDTLKKKECKRLHKPQQKDIDTLQKLEGVFVRYLEWDEKWAEWIFIKPNTICLCPDTCVSGKEAHRLAPLNTQSKYRQRGRHHEPEMTTIHGAPEIPGCVCLSNTLAKEGRVSFINSIIQCISNTPELLPYFITKKYEMDIREVNYMGMRGKFVREVANLLMDIWSNNYKVIKPESLVQTVWKYAPQFNETKGRNAMSFLKFLLDTLHNELNTMKWQPTSTKSKIGDLFHGLYTSTVTCARCKNDDINLKTYSYLSVPVSRKTFIVDVIHRQQTNHPSPNKPERHIVQLDVHATANDLAKKMAKIYKTKPNLLRFYENQTMQLGNEYKHDDQLSVVSRNYRDAIACYILRDAYVHDWIVAKVCHAQPRWVGFALFGIPFLISFAETSTQREINQIAYQRLHLWLGGNILGDPESHACGSWDWDWDTILNNLPFKLRFSVDGFIINLKNKLHDSIPCDNIVFKQLMGGKTDSIHIIVEWKQPFYDRVKGVLNKVIVTKQYSKWKQAMRDDKYDGDTARNVLTLYDCFDEYFASKAPIASKSKQWCCPECKTNQISTIKRDIWSFPEILIIHLDRGAALKSEPDGGQQEINGYVICPVNGLDLTKYAVDENIKSMSIYDLYATTNHIRHGYTCFAKNIENGQWYQLGSTTKQQTTKPYPSQEIIRSSTHILFYKKRSTHDTQSRNHGDNKINSV